MDELDRRIISLLQMDGRASNAKIAREVGVSEGTVRRRLRRLIQEDVVKVVAVPNLEKLGYATTALIGLQTGPGNRTLWRNPLLGWTRHIMSPSPLELTMSSFGLGWNLRKAWAPSYGPK